ncbi:hypothetical protein TPA0910_86980 [Streptomyces hygroscopicus subsp. sporocinereus]|uniref:Uncharacterized protein n=1 Tax=Streptomyces hygroscopicus TaxID=1912 RepID=A0ABQ3UF86_STRHY|nr:hypothetical protein [Streptomyces hygroscopicus]GHJ34265.1 hypothetical protein TPA0910_86980 [Streptomyces hygroscopicus]
MSVMTPARTTGKPTDHRTTEVDITTLPWPLQQVIETALEGARNAPTNDEYFRHMRTVITASGIHTSRGEAARCACDCMCDVLYDADDPDAHLFHDGVREVPQCPGCADDHRGRDAE